MYTRKTTITSAFKNNNMVADILHIPKQNLKKDVNEHVNSVSNVNIKFNTEKKMF